MPGLSSSVIPGCQEWQPGSFQAARNVNLNAPRLPGKSSQAIPGLPEMSTFVLLGSPECHPGCFLAARNGKLDASRLPGKSFLVIPGCLECLPIYFRAARNVNLDVSRLPKLSTWMDSTARASPPLLGATARTHRPGLHSQGSAAKIPQSLSPLLGPHGPDPTVWIPLPVFRGQDSTNQSLRRHSIAWLSLPGFRR